MAGNSLFQTAVIKVDDREVKLLFDLLKTSLSIRSIQDWLRMQVDPHMRQSFSNSFNQERSPEGKAWSQLADRTQISRRLLGYSESHPIMKRTNKVFDEVTTNVGQQTGGGYGMAWGIGLSAAYGANQVGRGKRGQVLPERRMIGFTPSDRPYIMFSLVQWIGRQIKGVA